MSIWTPLIEPLEAGFESKAWAPEQYITAVTQLLAHRGVIQTKKLESSIGADGAQALHAMVQANLLAYRPYSGTFCLCIDGVFFTSSKPMPEQFAFSGEFVMSGVCKSSHCSMHTDWAADIPLEAHGKRRRAVYTAPNQAYLHTMRQLQIDGVFK